jgi:hypothetical protein
MSSYDSTDSSTDELINFLSEAGLEDYIAVLMDNNYSSLDSLENMDDTACEQLMQQIDNEEDAAQLQLHIEDLQTIGVEEYRKNQSIESAKLYQAPDARQSLALPALPTPPNSTAAPNTVTAATTTATAKKGLSLVSSQAAVQVWLAEQGFNEDIAGALEDFSGRDMLQLTKAEACDLIGDEEGILLYQAIHSSNTHTINMNESDDEDEEDEEEENHPTISPAKVNNNINSSRMSHALPALPPQPLKSNNNNNNNTNNNTTKTNVVVKNNVGDDDEDEDSEEDSGQEDFEKAINRRNTQQVMTRQSVMAAPKQSIAANNNQAKAVNSSGASAANSDATDLSLITRGGVFLRYESDKRGSHKIYLYYSRDQPSSVKLSGEERWLGCVWWSERGVKEQLPNHFVRVDQLSDIYLGKEENVFLSPSSADAMDDHCFSLVSDGVTLNLEVPSADRAHEVYSWLHGLQLVLEENGSSVVLAEEDEKGNTSLDTKLKDFEADEDLGALLSGGMPAKSKKPLMKSTAATANPATSLSAHHNKARMTVLNTATSGINNSSGKKAIKEGWLYKMGGIRKNWTKRFFKIAEKHLEYYSYDLKAKTPFKLAGSIQLVGAIIKKVDNDISGRNNLFGINPPGIGRTYLLQAESEGDREDWIKAIRGFTSNSTTAQESVIDKVGYLTKLGGINKQWAKRKAQFRGGVLEWFRPDNGDLAGSVVITGAKLSSVAADQYPGRSHLFALIPFNSKRQFIFAADSEAERKSWVGLIETYLNTAEKHDAHSIKEGFLWKQSGDFGKILNFWQERYFVLTKTHLKYFKNKADKKPAGLIDLSMGGALNTENFHVVKREFAFSLIPTSNKNDRKYLMSAMNDKERQNWMAAMLSVFEQFANKSFT